MKWDEELLPSRKIQVGKVVDWKVVVTQREVIAPGCNPSSAGGSTSTLTYVAYIVKVKMGRRSFVI